MLELRKEIRIRIGITINLGLMDYQAQIMLVAKMPSLIKILSFIVFIQMEQVLIQNSSKCLSVM